MSEDTTGTVKPALGIDDGTYTLVAARRNENNDFVFRDDVNGFIEVELNQANKRMLKMSEDSGAPVFYPTNSNVAYIMGEHAREIAISWSSVLNPEGSVGTVFRRTMKGGILSVKDSTSSFSILATMLQALASPLPCDNCPIAFAYPGRPINMPENSQADPEFHKNMIIKMLSNVHGVPARPFGVNEAAAIVWSECQKEMWTGLGISFGAGMVNVALIQMSVEIFSFSFVGGGDWIDQQSSLASNVDPVIINEIKMGNEDEGIPGIDLTIPSDSQESYELKTIQTNYEILIGKVVDAIAQHIRKEGHRVGGKKPSVVVAGGTSRPKGFIELLQKKLNQAVEQKKFGDFKFGEVRMAKDPLYTVARGLLIAAEESERG